MPRVGLLSDSHSQTAITQAAVDLLVQHGAQLLIHLGDICGLQVIDTLLAPPVDRSSADPGNARRDTVPCHVVFGNMDHDKPAMARYAQGMGVTVDDPVGQMDFDTKQLIFMHGHDSSAMAQALEQQPAYLCHGHTHRKRDDVVNGTRVINPGALYRAPQFTVAMLDTDSDQLVFYRVDEA